MIKQLIKLIALVLMFSPLVSFATTLTISSENPEKIETYDIKALENISNDQVKTVTPWSEHKDLYDGIYVNDLIELFGFKINEIKSIKVTALNDYTAEISKESLQEKRYFLTYKKNGKLISIRQKGPITIILDFSDKAQGNNLLDIAYDQVWFVRDIKVMK